MDGILVNEVRFACQGMIEVAAVVLRICTRTELLGRVAENITEPLAVDQSMT